MMKEFMKSFCGLKFGQIQVFQPYKAAFGPQEFASKKVVRNDFATWLEMILQN